jgi:hypothetical protein
MIDWGARLDDLDHFLATQYRVQDRLAVEILLSALIDCPRTPALWTVLETNYYSRDCRRAWFAFDGSWRPRSLGAIRGNRPRNLHRDLTEWLEDSSSRLLVEPDFERPQSIRHLAELPFLLGKCLRIRARTAVTGLTQPVDERMGELRAEQLAEFSRRVLEDPIGGPQTRRGGRSRRVSCIPPNSRSACAASIGIGVSCVICCGSWAVRHAYLHGRSEVAQEDWQVLARVGRDTVPPWIARAIEHLNAAPDHHGSHLVLARAMRIDSDDKEAATYAKEELGRLRKAGLIEWSPKHKAWALVPEHAAGVYSVIAGRAFEVSSSLDFGSAPGRIPGVSGDASRTLAAHARSRTL